MKLTPVALLRLVPVSVTLVPTGPLVGLIVVMVGAANTVVFSSTPTLLLIKLLTARSGRLSASRSRITA